MAKVPIQFTLNGRATGVFAQSGANLIDVLRREAGDLTPKQGCAQGGCGACSVVIDGELRLACLTLAETVEGKKVETASSLSNGSELHPLQEAFVQGFAAQCGFCTPGMLMAAKVLLETNASPTRAEVAEAISGNLCRCTGYEPIINAILTAAAEMRERGVG